ncbi:predicted protein [Postia placenta Mad-698-R]|uniref:Protein phosphatase n=1 Tax=Postia placenta MAD-698-R-SB12 TaxID=670580 RepID=A0A1X6N8R2_9APHY|nr:hypothetical protein POSPLADRAFT_1044449 [Postia placenta MAD-698-R-SB12]EED84184.1 predicted protein [Postia placenta Mad-698-R]OSX65028.1 hypothetical protein POSPLADRAFT_1044449 [Postia placenta MAD-698-R-SB12]
MAISRHSANLTRSFPITKCQVRSVSSLPRPYRFHVGASWAGKPPDPQARRIKTKPFRADSEVGSHVGEDFFYVQEMRNGSGVSFGVADGVGGWIDSGVDPSLFSQALMYHARRYAMTAWAGEPETDPTQDYEERERVDGWEITPAECLELAYGGVLRERTVLAGVLRAAKQLTKLPASTPAFSRACIDSPRDADTFETKLRDGDIVVVYDTEDILVQTIAERIVDYAGVCMAKKNRVTPFERAAAREGMYFRGGKVDEWVTHFVTVVVALVRETI